MSLISWRSNRSKRVERSSSAAETQAAADEAVYIRSCLKEVLFGQLDLQNWQSEARQILAALVVDCRGVCDDLARSYILEEADENAFADDLPRDPKSATLIT